MWSDGILLFRLDCETPTGYASLDQNVWKKIIGDDLRHKDEYIEGLLNLSKHQNLCGEKI